jgi:2-polyprenyl-3-methyl-5-hydroxy-6-metoxy-1,4-benzoquinol methylase
MKQTPIHNIHNADLLALIPKDASTLVEIGCSSGALARAYRKLNSQCEYVGVEIDSDYAEVARAWCTRVIVANIEQMSDEVFGTLCPSSCWIFADVLEHLYDPWRVLRRIHHSLEPNGSIVACIPNMQHWSIQVRLNAGNFQYEDYGLMDRTHLRWFTKKTVVDLFQSTGFKVVDGGARVLEEPYRESALIGIRALADMIGTDVEEAATNATAFQWVVRAIAQ